MKFLNTMIKNNNMRLRLMQIILFFPCLIIDWISLFIIIPVYVICAKKEYKKEPFLQWLFELKEKEE
jgi:hypothetical protein